MYIYIYRTRKYATAEGVVVRVKESGGGGSGREEGRKEGRTMTGR
jgi:hypothetical protein